MNQKISPSRLIIISSIFFILFGNLTFFSNVIEVYPVNLSNSLFLLSLALVFFSINVMLLSLLCYKHTIKPVLITILLISASTAYFMDSYNVIIDDVMIDNIIKTDTAESLDLISLKFFIYFIFLGVLPSTWIYTLKITTLPIKKEIISKLKLFSFALTVFISLILIFGNFYASFIREHKPLRFYANPSYYLYSIGKYASSFISSEPTQLTKIGLDARIPPTDEHRELVFLVVGETVRSDHFSLNDYKRKTNPYLEKEDVLSFKNVWSCGTSTAVSVPCMFSIFDRSDYQKEKAYNTENVLDILQHAGVNVLWLDNNSDSKGVALRVPYESYKNKEINPSCDIECRDEGMLANLQRYINDHPQGDILIIMHQMGNHGPAYFKRYPSQFKKFTPTCETNQLENCTQQEIINTYDNAILYTDYFLSKAIKLLNKNNDQFEAALLYVSDHGESLGEKGLFLHGLPYMFAPGLQKRVPLLMWFSESFEKDEINYDSLKNKLTNKYSHDNIFHTLLGLMEIKTSIYNKSLDIIDHPDES